MVELDKLEWWRKPRKGYPEIIQNVLYGRQKLNLNIVVRRMTQCT